MSTSLQEALTQLEAAVAALPPFPPASPSGATIDSIGAYLIDGSGNFWSLVSGNRGNDNPAQMVSLNGATVPSGAVVLLLYFNGVVYQENSANNWWSWVNGAWTAVAGDPRVASSSGVPAYLNANGLTFTKKTYEYIPSAGPLANLDIAFDQSPGHAWYPYAWWDPNQDKLSASNFNFDPSDGALVITPGPDGAASIQSFQDIPLGGTGTINGNGFVGTHAFELDLHPNNGSGYWSMSKSHVSDGVTPVASNPLTLNSEIDYLESCSGGANAAAENANRALVPTTLHRNTSGGGGIPDTENAGNMSTAVSYFPALANGKLFDGQRHVLAGIHIMGSGIWIFADGVLVNEFTGANYYDSAPQVHALFIDYSGNYMLGTSNNPDPAELRIYRHTIYT
jgi:hypothetical protein